MSSKDIARLRRGFAKAPAAMAAAARRGLVDAGNQWRNKMVLDRFQPFQSNRNDGDTLQSRTGFLKRSLGTRTVGSTLNDLGLEVFSAGIRYARIQEYGGEVRPVSAKYLTIPLDAALGKRGIPKRNSIRDYAKDGGFFYVSKKGNLLFVLSKETGRGSNRKTELVPLYVLKKRVKIPPRFGMRLTFDQLAAARRKILQQSLVDGLTKALAAGGSSDG